MSGESAEAGRHSAVGPVLNPTRFQRCRYLGWRAPFTPATRRFVTRGPHGEWGNPFAVGKPASVTFPVDGAGGFGGIHVDLVDGAHHAVDLFMQMLRRSPLLVAKARVELSGFHLGCWCPVAPGVACHGDVLLVVANTGLVKLPQPALFDLKRV